MDKGYVYTRFCCPECEVISSAQDWDRETRRKFEYATGINHASREHCSYVCPRCHEESMFVWIAKASGYSTIEGYPNLEIKADRTPAIYKIPKMVDYHPGATSTALQLVNVLYEQALQQAELRVEIEAALERFDMDEYYKLVAKYREGEQVGAKIS